MTRRQRLGTLVVWFGLFATSAPALAQPSASDCARLLDAAQECARKGEAASKVETAYQQAFATCSRASLPLELAARYDASRAGFAFVHQGAADRAEEIYETALARVTAEGGRFHPARVPLLDGLADVLSSLALRNGGSERDKERAFGLYVQALEVREAAYGPDSVEAVDGLVMMSAAELQLRNRPDLGEAYARRALATSERVAEPWGSPLFKSLVMLEDALRRQGKSAEADEMRERAGDLLARRDELGLPPPG